MKIKTQDLIGEALDWAVAKCEKQEANFFLQEELRSCGRWYAYSTDPSQSWPIIEREKIRLDPRDSEWQANSWDDEIQNFRTSYGPTSLIAAMRCYVASKLGDEVDVPEELL